MFKVLVLACSLASPTDCWEFHDVRGPYPTYELCQKRAYVMGNDIMTMQGRDLRPKMFKCLPLKGQQL